VVVIPTPYLKATPDTGPPSPVDVCLICFPVYDVDGRCEAPQCSSLPTLPPSVVLSFVLPFDLIWLVD